MTSSFSAASRAQRDNSCAVIATTCDKTRMSLYCVNPDAIPDKSALVLVHGWGSGSWVWQPVQDQLCESFSVWLLDLPGYGRNGDVRAESVEQAVTLCSDALDCLPGQFVLLGWSLGGSIASLLAGQQGDRVRALITVATSSSFVSYGGEVGMDPQVFRRFQQDLDDDSERLLKRFSLLQSKGGKQSKECQRFLQENRELLEDNVLIEGLRWLQEIDLESIWHDLEVPVFHVYGKHDSLIPLSTACEVKGCFNKHRVQLFDSSAHLPFFDEPEVFVTAIVGFVAGDSTKNNVLDTCTQLTNRIDKRAVQRAFSRAAVNYDRLAKVQQRVASDLLGYLSCYPPCSAALSKPVVLDLGSGTGFLARLFPATGVEHFVQLDISEKMLQCAKQQTLKCPNCFVQGDINQLPFRDGSIDLAISSLSIQWSDDLVSLLADMRRCLSDKGRFLLSTLLPGSVVELEHAVSTLGAEPHVHEFVPAESVRQFAQSNGFTVARFEEKTYVEKFESGRALLASVKGIGAGNHRQDRSAGLVGKQRYRQFIAALESSANEAGELSLTYRVLFADFRK